MFCQLKKLNKCKDRHVPLCSPRNTNLNFRKGLLNSAAAVILHVLEYYKGEQSVRCEFN